MSQAGANNSSGGGGGGGIVTINGDVGSVTGPVVTLTGGSTGFIFTGVGTTLTMSGSASSFTWQEISADQTLAVNNGYFVSAGALSLALPATSAVGDTIIVSLEDTGTSFTITQGAGQKIRIGSNVTTIGATGTLETTAVGDTVTLVCYQANNFWQVTSIMGNLTAL